MLRLGHIVYSNAFPVHAQFIDEGPPANVTLVEGVPSDLNRLLADRVIDVWPCSSIEYARHADRYRLMPEIVIGAVGPVRSILLIGRPPEELDGRRIGLATASAASVVPLKILCRERWRLAPVFVAFDQQRDDPFRMGADAALFIGDAALRPGLHREQRARVDLAAEWYAHTHLPFAFALREYWRERRGSLAKRYARHFGLTPPQLRDYWNDLRFELDAHMIEGLRRFYEFAAAIGAIERCPQLVWG